MPQIRTSRLFARFPDLAASAFSGGVIAGLTGNINLPNPPKTPAELKDLKETFDEAIIATADGGSLQTAEKDVARAALIAALNKDASYVDINCNESLPILLSSGFQPVSSNRSQAVLDAPEIIAAQYAQAGQIRLRVTGDPNRKAIQGRVKPAGGEFGPVITFKNSREILFRGLVAGTSYVMQLCGLGGSTGQSDWSDPVTKTAV
jgi:hypothetical protein